MISQFIKELQQESLNGFDGLGSYSLPEENDPVFGSPVFSELTHDLRVSKFQKQKNSAVGISLSRTLL